MAPPQVRPPSPLLALPGAVAAQGFDDGIAWHYGDPIAEQRAAESSAALFDRSNRELITVTGDDRLTWLHTLTSQHLSDLADGASTAALVLSPTGHVEHHAVVTHHDGTVYLDTEPGAGAALAGYLDGMRFWSKVEVASTGDLAILTVAGPRAAAIVDAVDAAAGHPRFTRPTAEGIDLVVPRAELGATAAALRAAGATPAGSWAADALRIPTRRPRWGVDTDEKTIPNEVSWLQTAVHLNKGCYRGQETVARVHNLGRPPRRLVMLNLDGSGGTLPETGDPVTTGAGRTVGRLGTVAQHHELGPIALALVKRAVEPGMPLLAGAIDASVDPDDTAEGTGGAANEVPRSAIDHRAFSQIRRG
ncbi:YgfZ/GcvT domain-containing protein [Nakamurella sp.]|uniref:CAF17-like 4Fe-4S cluster assembly/insertion protein YgfZ n=1 Tax=Nakamurella sp. TaxID=1869182 RepID=UPI00378523D8